MTSKKALAIGKVNEHLGYNLLESSNTSFSSINIARPVWWLDINLKKFKSDLHLLLVKPSGLIWLRIKANTFPIPEEKFRYRSDKGCISLEILRNFPKSARRKAGLELRALQRGEMPTDFKSMSSIGPGVMEIRINVGNAYRIFYVAKFEEGIYVLHAFQKKAQRTSKKDIQLAQQRYRMMIKYRQG